MRILLLVHAFNSLSQRVHVELRELGHEVTVEFDVNDSVTREAVRLHAPDIVVAPFLKRAIPEDVWRAVPCLVVHPGPYGDRGPSSLDWAVLEGGPRWGVTVLQADAEMDGGAVWGSADFAMRPAAKGSLYRHEAADAAARLVVDALERLTAGGQPAPVDPADPRIRVRPPMRQADRRIDWLADDTAAVLRKIRSADGVPGVRDEVLGRPVSLFDAHPEPELRGRPGDLIARRDGAVCRATVDGAVWIGHMKAQDLGEAALKLPAEVVLGDAAAALPVAGAGRGDLRYEELDGVGYLHFAFYNGAMGPEQCARLRAAYAQALARPTRVLVLMGGPDFWSNGIHLNVIEAAASPAEESWRSINAIDDFARDVITTTDRIVVSALRGNAGAGGAFLALAADFVWARRGVVLNPHYKAMGNLYGSEYWTYLLPRRAGTERARLVTQARLPVGTAEAVRWGLIDDRFGDDLPGFDGELMVRAAALARDPALSHLIEGKRRRRAADEAEKPLAAYRAEELERMQLNFFGFDPSYHVARYNFVYKVPKSRTPYHLAHHRLVSMDPSPDRA